jgi:hypothetical protein
MPGIVAIREVAGPTTSSSDEFSFPQPSGGRSLRFDSPFEFAMGGYNWTATLVDEHQEPIRSWLEADDPQTLEPWSFDGLRVAFPPFSRAGSRVVAATPAGAELAPPPWPDGYLVSLQWAPQHDRLFLLRGDGVELFDGDFGLVAAPRWKHFEWPRAGWLTRGDHFFVLSREPGRDLRFYSGEDGHLTGAVSLAPEIVLPYEAERFDHLGRDEYVLEVSPGTTGVARLLDEWSQHIWHQETNVLLLQTYRPSDRSEPDRVTVKPRWVAVELSES